MRSLQHNQDCSRWRQIEPRLRDVFICSTSLISDIRARFSNTFTYEGKRALMLTVGDQIPTNELRECVRMALTHHPNDHRR
jgi:hypothetical protein